MNCVSQTLPPGLNMSDLLTLLLMLSVFYRGQTSPDHIPKAAIFL